MAQTSSRKRSAVSERPSSKKRKLSNKSNRPKTNPSHTKAKDKTKEKGKERAFDRETIPIPEADEDSIIGLSEQDEDLLEEYGGAASFLSTLDKKGIARSKKETERLHSLNKPVRKPIEDDLPSIDSQSEDENEDWSSADDHLELSDTESLSSSARLSDSVDSDIEMPYEAAPRKRRASWDENDKPTAIQRLPIKFPGGRIQKTGAKTGVPLPASDVTSESEEEDEDENRAMDEPTKRSDVATAARFGRPAVVDVLSTKSRKARIQQAKDQIAGICQEVVGDPENSLGLLRRLHTFSLPKISTSEQPEPVTNDIVIRKLAILSQLAVFKDIIPGYRIRALTDTEKAEKVSQMVARTRDWEQGLVGVYQNYLQALEAELKAKSELSEIALHCMCTLVDEVTHFNFRSNLLACIVARLSKKSWDKASELCLSTLIKVFKSDNTGDASLETVRLINRMVKEKRYNVHPDVLSCLLHLRLKSELGVRSSDSKVDKNQDQSGKTYSKNRAAARRAKGKRTDQPYLSKKAQKAAKEKKEIDKEMKEAEAEVDKEERVSRQTETLKLLFVLYFSILKNPVPTPLLPAALRGISKYAHMVNIDFFKDLMQVLKHLIEREAETQEDSNLMEANVHHQLLCIVTAFELLSGQGEALNLDLSDFVTQLYTIILPLSTMPEIETQPTNKKSQQSSVADMLFRALNIIFSPKTFGTASPSWRSAAFSKRLLISALHWPSATALRAVNFVQSLLVKDSKLEALLSTEDRNFDGVCRPELDDPQLCNAFGGSFWELHVLKNNHWDAEVRAAAEQLARYTRS